LRDWMMGFFGVVLLGIGGLRKRCRRRFFFNVWVVGAKFSHQCNRQLSQNSRETGDEAATILPSKSVGLEVSQF
jgi:hypothetical protein